MAGIMHKLKFIRDSVFYKKTDEKTTRNLYILQKDNENIPIYKVPVSVLSTAALSVLGILKYKGNDEDVFLWEDNLKMMVKDAQRT